MSSKIALSFTFLSCITMAVSAGAQSGLDDIRRNIANQTLDLQASIPVQIASNGRIGQRMLIGVSAGFMLDLNPHSVRAHGFRVLTPNDLGGYDSQPVGVIRTMRGRIVGRPDSVVAGSMLEDGLHARIVVSPTEEYWIQPAAPYLPGAGKADHLLYRTKDVQLGHRHCDTDGLALPRPNGPRKSIAQLPAASTPTQARAAAAAVQSAELACAADYEYYSTYGSVSATTAQIESIINTMNTQYERDLDVTHAITAVVVQTSSSQPYSSLDAGTLLDQFRNHWNANHGGVQRDVAHLFTGKELNGSTIGIAWVGVICHGSYGYGLVQSDFDTNFACKTDLSAHEIGHNWDANHCSCSSYTMNAYITCANRFHPQRSIREMKRFRDSLSCLGMPPTGNPTEWAVASVTASTQGVGQGNKIGKATVVITDDLGALLPGATVTGDFSGDINESGLTGVTNGSGSVTLSTTGTARGGVRITFCVTSVTASLPAPAPSPLPTCDSN